MGGGSLNTFQTFHGIHTLQLLVFFLDVQSKSFPNLFQVIAALIIVLNQFLVFTANGYLG